MIGQADGQEGAGVTTGLLGEPAEKLSYVRQTLGGDGTEDSMDSVAGDGPHLLCHNP